MNNILWNRENVKVKLPYIYIHTSTHIKYCFFNILIYIYCITKLLSYDDFSVWQLAPAPLISSLLLMKWFSVVSLWRFLREQQIRFNITMSERVPVEWISPCVMSRNDVCSSESQLQLSSAEQHTNTHLWPMSLCVYILQIELYSSNDQ